MASGAEVTGSRTRLTRPWRHLACQTICQFRKSAKRRYLTSFKGFRAKSTVEDGLWRFYVFKERPGGVKCIIYSEYPGKMWSVVSIIRRAVAVTWLILIWWCVQNHGRVHATLNSTAVSYMETAETSPGPCDWEMRSVMTVSYSCLPSFHELSEQSTSGKSKF